MANQEYQRRLEAIRHHRDEVTLILKSMTYRERRVIELRYGLGDGYIYTLEECGRIFKVTRERIRGIEKKALRKIAHLLGGATEADAWAFNLD